MPARADPPRMGEALGVAVALGCVTATLAYAALRGVDVVFFPEPNPVSVVWTERSTLVWRSAGALYLGGMGAIAGYALAARAPDAAATWLGRLVLIGASAVTLVGALLP